MTEGVMIILAVLGGFFIIINVVALISIMTRKNDKRR